MTSIVGAKVNYELMAEKLSALLTDMGNDGKDLQVFASATNNAWIIDFGATEHMTCDSRQIQTLKPSTKTFVSVANSNVALIIGEGTVSLSDTLNLDTVLVVPTLDYNLFAHHCLVIFWPSFCVFKDIRTRKTIGYGIKKGKLYYLELAFNSTRILTQALVMEGSREERNKDSGVWLWLRHLGHASFSGDILERSGDHSQENNVVNDLELSGNILETSGDHLQENNVENLERDKRTPDNSLSAPPYNLVSPTISQSVSPPLSPNNHNQSSSISDAPQRRLPDRVNREALTEPRWQTVMNEELKSLKKNATWEITDLPAGKKHVGCKWVYTVKYKVDGMVDRFKARLVVKGQSNSDHTLFLKRQNGKLTALIVYVNDMVVIGNDPEERVALQSYLSTEFEMKDLGYLKYFPRI
ncbi:uncharacterized protein [Malus domestica]|uniref:uncharacterized protein n=1 Tax=Malus domestica TaxID=3750 RepID=UPI00397718D2